MVEKIHNRDQWARIPSAAAVKKVKKRRANDGKKDFFKNFDKKYTGKGNKEVDETQLAEEDQKRPHGVASSKGTREEETKRVRKKGLGDSIDIHI